MSELITVDEQAIEQWTNVPIDDIGYMSSVELLGYGDVQLRDLIYRMQINRYGDFHGIGSWRNHGNRWRDILLDMWGLKAKFAHVLDYGCGAGLESLIYAREGVMVSQADISVDNLRLACRVLDVFGCGEQYGASYLVGRDDLNALWFDVVHCVGVLHHIPDPYPTMKLFADICSELRLMVYSDEGWRIAMHSGQMSAPPPTADHPCSSSEREQFIRYFDSVGNWADWYDEAKLQSMFGHLFTITHCEYITQDGRYLAAVLKPSARLM